jgi:hypothetical protein
MEEDEQPTELTQSNERSDSDSKEERRREEAENRPFWRKFWPGSRP